jgi:3'-phosphoadenosine 5'-phosphosulfate sulfotransferase (PAPS reductase)/FAD synthetase
MTEHNIISFSGGKDSTAMLLLAIERETPSLSVVFADTGNEHEQTYDYVRYVEQATGVPIRWVKADFSPPDRRQARIRTNQVVGQVGSASGCH